MNRSQLSNHSYYRAITCPIVNVSIAPAPVSSDNSDITKVIYTYDKEQGVIHGDLAMYMSNDTRPELRQFIVNNLLGRVESVGKIPNGLSDSDVENLSLRSDDTIDSYTSRVRTYLDSIKPKEEIKSD